MSEVFCKRCLMSNRADLDFKLTELGCNYCEEFMSKNNQKTSFSWENLVQKIKSESRGKKYDCIVGVSGGVDSSYVLKLVKESGLNPLAVHMDNGWNSELAQNNIHNLVKSLKVDYHAYIIDWNEYKSLMEAFFSADVVDVELLYDNAMYGVNYKLARKYGVKHILGGMNTSTEGFQIPDSWNWFKLDGMNIKDIARKKGVRIKTFPIYTTKQFLMDYFIRKIRWENPLDLIEEYNKENVLNILEKNHGYKRYEYKHFESIFTRFYQGYILPAKFGIDKRKVHLSNLVLTNQLSLSEAKEILKQPIYTEKNLRLDTRYFLDKLDWTKEDLEEYIKRHRREHFMFKSERKTYFRLLDLYKKFFK